MIFCWKCFYVTKERKIIEIANGLCFFFFVGMKIDKGYVDIKGLLLQIVVFFVILLCQIGGQNSWQVRICDKIQK